MSPPQIIRTPSGEELVVLPRAEYERSSSVPMKKPRMPRMSPSTMREKPNWPPAAGAAPGVERRDSSRRESAEGHPQLARRDANAIEFQNRHRSGLSVRSRKWTPYGNPRDHREARAGFGCAGGVAFVNDLRRPCYRPRPSGFRLSVRNVSEYRRLSTAGMLCSHSVRAAPRKR